MESALIIHVYVRGSDGYLNFQRTKCGLSLPFFAVDPTAAGVPSFWTGYHNPAICLECAVGRARHKIIRDPLEVISDVHEEDSEDDDLLEEVTPIQEPLNEPEELDNFLESLGT